MQRLIGRNIIKKSFHSPRTPTQLPKLHLHIQASLRCLHLMRPYSSHHLRVLAFKRQRARQFSSHSSPMSRLEAFFSAHLEKIGLLGFGLITIQWMMTDVLMIRTLGMACSSLMIMFNHFRTPPIGVAVKFNLLFVCINGYFISQILAERREDVELADHETSLWETCFANSALTKVQMRDLLGAGTVGTNSGKGTVWCTAGKAAPQTVFLLAKGKASVTNGRGEHLATIGPGEFVGELGWLADTKEHRVSTVSVVFTEPCTFVEWPARDLTSHLNNSRKKDVKLGFEAMLALQISHKLERMNDASALEVAYCNLVLGVLYGREEVGLEHRAFVRAWAEQRGLLPKGAAV